VTAVEIVERAKDCLAGKSRSYVEDAKVFAKVILDLFEGGDEGAATPSPCASSETSGGGGGPSAG
jgi:hypothetical protein